MRKLAATVRDRHKKPRMRMAQAQPTFANRDSSMSGKMTPPRLPAVEAMPVARPRRTLKKWPMAAMEGVKRREQERPDRTPKARRNW
jgi:hypothetical protein